MLILLFEFYWYFVINNRGVKLRELVEKKLNLIIYNRFNDMIYLYDLFNFIIGNVCLCSEYEYIRLYKWVFEDVINLIY